MPRVSDRSARAWLLTIAALVLLLGGSCTDAGADSSPAEVEETTRAPRPGSFVPEQPTDREGALYFGYADLILSETPWTMAQMGRDAWGRMLIDGALTACRSYHEGATTLQAIEAVLADSPRGAATPAADDVDAYDLLSVFFIGGVDAFCPTLVEDIYGSVFASGFDPAWEQLTGGPAPSRPVRLP